MSRRTEQLLRTTGLKVTPPRQAVLKVLLDQHGPLSVEQIQRSLKRGECDLVTIYRTTAALEKAQVLTRCDFGDGISRYELTGEHGAHHHHHILCTECRKVESVEFCLHDSWTSVLKSRGYSQAKHRLEFSGICSSCSASGRSHPHKGASA
jgi:Fur family ferric uptake transcriptional regulator